MNISFPCERAKKNRKREIAELHFSFAFCIGKKKNAVLTGTAYVYVGVVRSFFSVDDIKLGQNRRQVNSKGSETSIFIIE